MLLFEPWFAKPVLFGVVMRAQADAPAVGRLERSAAIGAGAHMGAFDGPSPAAGNRAVMPADPGAVGRTSARSAALLRALQAIGKPRFRHRRSALALPCWYELSAWLGV